MVSEEAFVAAYERVAAAGGAELTFFEQVTAIAFLVIAEANLAADEANRAAVDARGAAAKAKNVVTVVEVGLGGRLDATNVVDAGIAVITGVAMDHEAILGNTLDAIAYEKAGICKPDQPVVIGACGEPEGVPMLVAHARANKAREPIVVREGSLGPHQRRNAALALAVMQHTGLPHDPAALADVQHPGRFEILVSHRVILDGAHNPHGARALAATLRERGFTPVLVLAVSADKDARAIAEALLPQVQTVIATRYQQERAMDPEVLAQVLREVRPELTVVSVTDLPTALMRARAKGQWTLIAGSLFIVGEARALLLGAPVDPVRLSDPVSPR
jgi:dihydrofolate synthase/folylpolyglutamate synthase